MLMFKYFANFFSLLNSLLRMSFNKSMVWYEFCFFGGGWEVSNPCFSSLLPSQKGFPDLLEHVF